MPFAASTVRVAGCDVHLRRAGRGRPLLFLHGTIGLDDAPAVLETLAADHQVVLPDHPGFGRSGDADWLFEIGDMAYFYLDLLDALDLDGVHLVGHDLGGWIAAEIAVRSQQRLSSLTLIGAAGLHVEGAPKADIFLMDWDELLPALYADRALAKQARAVLDDDEALAVLGRNEATSARLGWQPRLFNPGLARWLHRIRIPTLVLWGEGDRIIPPGHAHAFAERIQGATVETIPDTGHMPHIERPALVAQRIGRFIAEVA